MSNLFMTFMMQPDKILIGIRASQLLGQDVVNINLLFRLHNFITDFTFKCCFLSNGKFVFTPYLHSCMPLQYTFAIV
jgi:hypothetical protein